MESDVIVLCYSNRNLLIDVSRYINPNSQVMHVLVSVHCSLTFFILETATLNVLIHHSIALQVDKHSQSEQRYPGAVNNYVAFIFVIFTPHTTF